MVTPEATIVCVERVVGNSLVRVWTGYFPEHILCAADETIHTVKRIEPTSISRSPWSLRCSSRSSFVLFALAVEMICCDSALVRSGCSVARSDCSFQGTKQIEHGYRPCRPRMRAITHLRNNELLNEYLIPEQ
jgi:hypothetical protein